MQGKVFLIGAGPGDPGLITVKGLQCLQKADTVVYDHLAAVSLLAHAQPNAELIYAGKEADAHAIPQNKLNSLLVDKAREGKTVARLKGGDPYVFGRGGEEALALEAAGIPFEVVPGVSSAVAGPMYAGIPVTHRGLASSVTVITGHEDPAKNQSAHNWQALAQTGGTLVFLMGMRNLGHIASLLLAHGKNPQTPAAVIQNATTACQRTLLTTLENLETEAQSQNFGPPAIIVLGQTANLSQKLNWFSQQPLFGRQILITRQGPLARNMAQILEDWGAQCVNLPVFEICPLPKEPLAEAIESLGEYDWLAFTSQNAVKLFFKVLEETGKDCRCLCGLKIAAIGEVTAGALAGYGLKADLVPPKYVAESMAEVFKAVGIAGQKILLPRAQNAREVLPQTLRQLGATVNVVPVYQTVPAVYKWHGYDWLLNMDTVTFTSASTVTMLQQMLPPQIFSLLAQKATAACIGPITARAAQQAGFAQIITAPTHTGQGLCRAILQFANL